MPLSVSDGLGAWVDDFKKSDAPQFKGKSAKERREMAIAAYLSAKRGDKNEAYDNPPFTPDPPKKDVKNSDQTKQSPMSRARALAKKARDAQKTNENNSAPQTAAHRRAMMVGVMKQRAKDNEKARQALKDPDHNPAWANSKSKLEATDTQKQIADLEKMLGRMSGNTSSVKMKKYALQRKIDKLKGQVKEARDPSKSGGSGYNLYHKDFSSAMQHAYKYAKDKLGVVIDPKQIDDLVASGPRKPSSGKTNSYSLLDKTGKKRVMIQVANLDNKKYELNMYKESVEIHEAVLANRDYKVKDGRVHISKANFTKVHKDYKNATAGKERMTVLDPKSQATVSMPVRFESVEIDESVAKAYEIMKPTKSMNHGIEAIKKTMKVDHGTATRLARQVMDKVKKGEFKEGTADRYKMIKKIGDKINKEKKKAERDAMKHAKRDNEYQAEGKAEEVKGANAANAGQSYSSNPYPRGTPEHLSWSKGHNSARARRLNMGEAKLDELSPATHDRYQKAAHKSAVQGVAQMRMGTRTPKSMAANQKKRQAGIDTSKFLNRKQHGVKPTYEEFTMKHYRKNEDENRHSENALQLAKKFGSKKEIETVQGIHDRHMKRGHITEPDRSTRDKIARKHYPKLKETTSVKKTNEATQFKVDVEGLPPTFMNGKSVGEILAKLRKIVKQPSMIQSVDRVTAHDVKKTYRDKAQGKED